MTTTIYWVLAIITYNGDMKQIRLNDRDYKTAVECATDADKLLLQAESGSHIACIQRRSHTHYFYGTARKDKSIVR